jgi:hypothetical protein
MGRNPEEYTRVGCKGGLPYPGGEKGADSGQVPAFTGDDAARRKVRVIVTMGVIRSVVAAC